MGTMNAPRVAIYCRVANESQLAMDSQKEHLTRHASALGYTNLAYYGDNGASGLAFDRPGLVWVTGIEPRAAVPNFLFLYLYVQKPAYLSHFITGNDICVTLASFCKGYKAPLYFPSATEV